ncbi:hypothetical protein ACFORO_12610 [Amycolatopsis halotolerans]|uniref:Uncharacterized protein n=1 Tax=Amycolatopsis halotolerans TaxID=330083 RepID=A0ABV7QFF4_9PSEU
MATYVVLVEFELPDEGPGADFAIEIRPLIDALRELSPAPPVNVTAFARDSAATILRTVREL